MKQLNIGSAWYPVMTLGYGKRIGVWTQGCPRNCAFCISPEFQSWQGGNKCYPHEIFAMIPREEEPDGMTISGGEPFAQAEALLELIQVYKTRYQGDILVFTGYTLRELIRMESPVIQEILSLIDVLVDGEYVEELNDGMGLRGSSNQNIHIFHYHERYKEAEEWKRQLQCVFLRERIWMIGIPPL